MRVIAGLDLERERARIVGDVVVIGKDDVAGSVFVQNIRFGGDDVDRMGVIGFFRCGIARPGDARDAETVEEVAKYIDKLRLARNCIFLCEIEAIVVCRVRRAGVVTAYAEFTVL